LSESLATGASIIWGGKELRSITFPGGEWLAAPTAGLILREGLRETEGESERNGVIGGARGLLSKWELVRNKEGGPINPSATRGGESDGDNRAQKLGNPLGDDLADDVYPSSSSTDETFVFGLDTLEGE